MQRNAVDRLDFGRTGKHRYAAHDEGIANHIVFIQRNSDENPRFKAAAGTPDAHAAFLAQGIKGAVKLMDLPAAKRHLAKPGEGGDGDECGDHIGSLTAGWRLRLTRPTGIVAPVSAAPPGNELRTSPAHR